MKEKMKREKMVHILRCLGKSAQNAVDREQATMQEDTIEMMALAIEAMSTAAATLERDARRMKNMHEKLDSMEWRQRVLHKTVEQQYRALKKFTGRAPERAAEAEDEE